MKKFLLAGTILAACGTTSAYATGCTTVGGGVNLHFLSCTSDTQANDGDDVKMFVDNINDASSVFGSLGKNVNIDHDVTITSLGGTFDSTTGNGFANFKSVKDTVEGYTATPDPGSILPIPPGIFEGFDGELFRGQLVDNTSTGGTWDGDVSIIVTLSDGTAMNPDIRFFTFKGFKKNKDIGVLGFDEIDDPGVFVTSALAYAGDVDSKGNLIAQGVGSWDEFKQIEFSVPGAVAQVPEIPTWAMALTGFALFGLAGWRGRRKNETFASL
jgi:hypothetical protein